MVYVNGELTLLELSADSRPRKICASFSAPILLLPMCIYIKDGLNNFTTDSNIFEGERLF